ATGPGVFFDNQVLPNATAGTETCFPLGCTNVSNDPSINVTSYGTMAVAYTSWTNASPCAAAIPYAESEVAVVISTNGGTSWSAPTLLGAPASCSTAVAQAEPDAWEPSVTSLANGTLVLVYVAFNSTTPLYLLGLGPGTFSVSSDRLMLAESYDNGTSWTSPTALNVSDNPLLTNSAFTSERPWVTAVGSTVYVTWMNLTAAPGLVAGVSVGSAAIELLASTNGGATWPAQPTTLPVVAGGTGLQVAINPYPLVLPNGTLVVAYATNFTFEPQFGCLGTSCLANTFQASVVAAMSTNNGSTFSLATVAPTVVVAPNGAGTAPRAFESFQDPSPELAYGAASGQLVVAFSAGELLSNCSALPCFPWVDSQMIYVDNSSDGGASWATAHVALPSTAGYGLFGTYYPSESYNPAIAIDANGTVDLAFTFVNFTLCSPTASYGTNCGPEQEVFGQSTDNGATFSGPILVAENWSWQYNNPTAPDGEYATAVVVGGELWMAWTTAGCPGWGTVSFYGCGFPGTAGGSEVVVSHVFHGAGVSLSFTESGLPNGTTWWASVLGNLRSGLTPATLSVSGIPTGVAVGWTFSGNLSIGYGSRYAGIPSLTAPTLLTSNTTVAVSYSQEVLLQVSTTPAFASASASGGYYYCPGYPAPVWNDPACPGMNWNVTPGVGAMWVSPGTPVTLNASPIGSVYCGVGVTCYNVQYLNLSFLSWTGNGLGSVNTTANRTTVTVTGPVNETANFLMTGWCEAYLPPYYTLSNQCIVSNTTLTFHETGLPSGTAWTVSTVSAYGNATVTNTTAWNSVTGGSTVGVSNFQVWTVPAPGGYWVPTTTPASPVILPLPLLVNVNFTFVTSLASDSFEVDVATSGLPSGLPWSVTLNTTYGVPTGNVTSLTVPSGTYTVGGGTVIGTNGTEYVVTGVDFRSDIVNRSGWSNGSAPGTITLVGPAEVILVYSPRYWLDVAATNGGSAGPSDAWFVPSAAVTLSESAEMGYYFAGWAGTGPGATSGAQDQASSPTIHIGGPVTELANFVSNGSLGVVAQVSEVGLPTGEENFSFSLDGAGHTAAGTATVNGLTNQSYTFVAENATDLGAGVLGAVTGWTTSYVVNPNGTIEVDGAGTIQVNYSVLDQVSTTAVGDGLIAPGSGWVPNGTVFDVTATAAGGWELASLTSNLPYVNVTNTTFRFDAVAPGSIVAEFARIPTTTTPTYALAITETGLPNGGSWNVSVTSSTGTAATGGIGATLTVGGLLAGSYNVTVSISYGAAGVRYVPGSVGAGPIDVPSTGTAAVAFATEYLLTVVAASGGTASPGTEWKSAGSAQILSESPSSGQAFEGWNGTGTGSYTGNATAPNVTVSGPVTETAAFGPAPTHSSPTNSSGSSFPTLGVGLLVLLLVVGAVVGILLGRRGGGSASPAEPTEETPGAPAEETLYGQSAPDAGPDGETEGSET
ncbi:MAG: exo-alpha-sialidase, partial [Thermoplasmata archaeon]|nr:exo-alpha-sialidase [Thermoplasmata archaeon]